MTDVFTLWLGRLLSGARPASPNPPGKPQPMWIEVERLPDYLWRDLGFQVPARRDDDH